MRKLTYREVPLVKKLLELSRRPEEPQQLLVDPMDDGGMGSLRIGQPHEGRKFGSSIAEVQFSDQDGTLVTAVLNVDAGQALYEVDVWKTDFSALQRWPSENEIEAVPTSQSRREDT